jgi:hypothetical protein
MYRLTIWLIAVVFAFNGAASLAWIDLPAAPALTVDSHYGAAVAVWDDAHSYDVDGDVIAAVPDHGHATQHADKCCVTCSVASVVPDAAVTAITFSCAAVAFHTRQRDLVGHLVALDPDIPKTIV